MTISQTKFQQFGRIFISVIALATALDTANADSVSILRTKTQFDEYGGRVVSMDSSAVYFATECGGVIKRYTWPQIKTIYFSPGCEFSTPLGSGGFPSVCEGAPGEKPRKMFLLVDKKDVDTPADYINLEGEFVYYRMPGRSTIHKYNRKTDGLVVMYADICKY